MGGGPRVVVSTAAFHARVRGSVPGLGGLKETKLFLPHPRVKVSIVGSLRDREVACSASDRQGSNFESCVWRTVSSQSSHHPQEVLLAQFSLYVHKGGLKPDSFRFLLDIVNNRATRKKNSRVPVFASLPQYDLATEKNVSHLALVFALVCGQSSRHSSRAYSCSRWCVLYLTINYSSILICNPKRQYSRLSACLSSKQILPFGLAGHPCI